MLEAAIVAGILSAGGKCVNVGVMPTPAIAFLTKEYLADGGIVISASHNPFEDNGIKFFGAGGSKFPDAWEEELEGRLAQEDRAPRPTGKGIGSLKLARKAERDYLSFLRRVVPLTHLGGMKIVLDCANGATCRVAPKLFRDLGAHVVTIGTRPNGRNINARVGALHPEALSAMLRESGAQLGLAFDGDGDRLMTVDETGAVRDGDYVLAICARQMKIEESLKGNCVVTTVMANLGLEQSLREVGIQMVRTQVGDRYVLEEMQQRGANLGGEQSGHLIFLDQALTGDGVLSALQLLAVMEKTGKPLSELSRCLTKFPQLLLNVPVKAKPPIEQLPKFMECLRGLEESMNGRGRILVRYSGTEPLARIMVEGEDPRAIESAANELAEAIRRELGGTE
jgi:phosphoglucosamine mutase